MRRAAIRHFTVIPLAAVVCVVLAACGGQSGGSSPSHSSASSGAGGSSGSGSSGGSSGSGSSGGSSGSGGYGAYGGSSGGSSTSGSASAATSAGATSLRLAKTSKGMILVDSKGFTAYLFTADHGSTDRCVKVTGCTSTWPPLTVKGNPTAGSGIKKSMLGTTKLPNGTEQLTYAGHPLYGYTGDSSPANTSYIGITSFGGTWLAVSATGSAVR